MEFNDINIYSIIVKKSNQVYGKIEHFVKLSWSQNIFEFLPSNFHKISFVILVPIY